MSSGGAGVVVPGEGFVVGLAGLQDAVEDADPAAWAYWPATRSPFALTVPP
jgi:hypothetical protein